MSRPVLGGERVTGRRLSRRQGRRSSRRGRCDTLSKDRSPNHLSASLAGRRPEGRACSVRHKVISGLSEAAEAQEGRARVSAAGAPHLGSYNPVGCPVSPFRCARKNAFSDAPARDGRSTVEKNSFGQRTVCYRGPTYLKKAHPTSRAPELGWKNHFATDKDGGLALRERNLRTQDFG